jgi:hypothetical protein
MQNGAVAMENNMVELKKLNMQLLYEPSIPILGIYLRKN